MVLPCNVRRVFLCEAVLLWGIWNVLGAPLRAEEAVAHNAAEQKFINFPALPTCA